MRAPPPVVPASTAAPPAGSGGGDSPWVRAVTDEGVEYFWHAETRATRWTPPDEGTQAAMASRLAAEREATAARAAARLAEMAAAEEDAALREEVRAAVAGEVGAAVEAWTGAAGWPGKAKGMSKDALVACLAALLGSLHTLPHLPRAPGQAPGAPYAFAAKLPATAGAAEAGAVGKVFLRAARVVHPDKLPPGDGATVQARLMATAAFDALVTVHNAVKG